MIFYLAAILLKNVIPITSSRTPPPTHPDPGDCFKGGDHHICLPEDYSKYDLPTFKESVLVTIEVHIKDIPKVGTLLRFILNDQQFCAQVSDQDFSITLDTYFNVKWRDARLVSSLFNKSGLAGAEEEFSMTAVNVNILPKLWIPDLEIMDLMSFETHKILSKLEGNHAVGVHLICLTPTA